MGLILIFRRPSSQTLSFLWSQTESREANFVRVQSSQATQSAAMVPNTPAHSHASCLCITGRCSKAATPLDLLTL